MIIRLYRFFKGILKIEFNGEFKERIFTVCATNGIAIWGTKLKKGSIESFITVEDFKYLRKISRGKGIKVHIVKRLGFPFISERYKKRIGIPLGVILFFTIIGFMTQYIWIIDINGNHKISEKDIINACRNIGVVEGIKKNSIYPKAEKEKLMLQLDEIAWASMNIEGSRLTVNITETKEKKEDDIYTNLTAKTDAIIEKIDIKSGTCMVMVGQAVKKGDLLVSGIIETAEGTKYVKSKGTIIAKSQNEIKISENFEQLQTVFTNSKTKRVVEIFGLKIPMFFGGEKGEFDTKTNVDSLKLFNSNLPIRIYEKTFLHKEKRKIKYDYEILCKRLDKNLEKKLNENDTIISRKFISEENGIALVAIIENKENIALSNNLLISAGN